MESECCGAEEWYNTGRCSECKEHTEFTEEEEVLDKSDVIRIAKSIGVDLSLKEIKQIIEEHNDECENDPTATWGLVVENQIYNR